MKRVYARRLGPKLGLVQLVLLSGCYTQVPQALGPRSSGSLVSQSLGRPALGVLLRGQPLPDRGPGFVRARPGESTRYGNERLVGALQRAAALVAARFPGTHPLRIGDLSAPQGGRHSRHGSHRTGRDADIIFYATDAMGRPVRGRGWLAYDRFGVARETRRPSGEGSGDIFFFDDARNWAWVRALLADREALVQWIFCSRGVKARLLRYAAEHEPDPDVLLRASWVLHQPGRGHPHDDHFHVRLACSPDEKAIGCRQGPPHWPWLSARTEKSWEAGQDLGDEVLLKALLDPMEDLALSDPGA